MTIRGLPQFFLKVGLIALAAGCCTTHRSDPVSEFRRKHPVEAKDYVYVHPTSMDIYSMLIGERVGSVNSIAVALQERFANVQGVADYAQAILNKQAAERKHAIDYLREIESAGEGGGIVCQFKWTDGTKEEIGLLVLKAGEIIRREVWHWELLQPQSRADGNSSVPK